MSMLFAGQHRQPVLTVIGMLLLELEEAARLLQRSLRLYYSILESISSALVMHSLCTELQGPCTKRISTSAMALAAAQLFV